MAAKTMIERAKRLLGAWLVDINWIMGGVGLTVTTEKEVWRLRINRYRCSSGGGKGNGLRIGFYRCYTSLKSAIPLKPQIIKLVFRFWSNMTWQPQFVQLLTTIRYSRKEQGCGNQVSWLKRQEGRNLW